MNRYLRRTSRCVSCGDFFLDVCSVISKGVVSADEVLGFVGGGEFGGDGAALGAGAFPANNSDHAATSMDRSHRNSSFLLCGFGEVGWIGMLGRPQADRW